MIMKTAGDFVSDGLMLTVVLANIIHVLRVRRVYGQFSLQRLLSTGVGLSLK